MPETGIQWGSTNGHMQVGINVRYSTIGSSTTQADVVAEYWVRSISWGYSDPQTLNYSDYHSGSTNYTMSSPNGSTTAIMVSEKRISGVSTSYSGGPTFKFTAQVSGAYDGSTPSKSVTFTLPARPASAPSAPNPSWSSLGSTSVTVSCNTPSSNGASITDYQIQVDDSSGFGSPVGTFDKGNTVSGLKPGTKYYIRARAKNSVGWSSWSATENFTTSAATPSTPSAPSVSDIGNQEATLTWSAPSNNGASITNYGWQVATDSGFSNVVKSGTGNVLTTDITGLDPNTNYYARVRAYNSVGWSSYSSGKLFKTSATTATAPVTLSVSSIAHTYATATWTAPSDDGGSTVTSYEIQVATNSSFTQNVKSLTSSTLSKYINNLYAGMTWYIRVRAVNAAGTGAWKTSSFSTLAPVPEIIRPVNGAIASVLGKLSVTYFAWGLYGSSQIHVNVTNGTDSFDYVLNLSAASADNEYTIVGTDYLKTGTWSVKARVYNEQQATYTSWSPVTTFLQSHTPTAQVVSPVSGAVLKYDGDANFQFTFVDPAGSLDRRTAYRFVIEKASDATPVYDTGKVASVGTYGTSQIVVNATISATYENIELRWRVMVWDQGDTPSNWSGWSLFTLADEPAIAITAPTNGSTVLTGAPTFTWTATPALGATQAEATLTVVDDISGDTVFEEQVEGGIFSVTPTQTVLTNLTDYTVTVVSIDSNGIDGSASASFSTEYETPDSFAYDIDVSQVDTAGFVSVTWRDATADAAFINWKVYRRELGKQAWTLLKTITDVNTREYRDYLVVAGVSYSYAVTQTATRSGEPVEGPVGFRDDYGNIVPEGRTTTAPISMYWLIDSVDGSFSVGLPGVNSDSPTLEFEDASYTIIGRGRHVDYGDELGYSGSLTVKVRNPEPISTIRQKVETLRRRKRTLYLRTPHGRLIAVALGNIGWSPLAGAGEFDMGDMTIPYMEVR